MHLLGRPASPSPWAGPGGIAGRRAAWIGTAVAAVVFLLLATAGRPWLTFARGPFTSDFYDVQARALSRGHLDVPPAVAGIEGFVNGGETHFYYGIVPAVARLPVSAITHALDGRLVLVSMVGGIVVACTAAARLLQRGRGAVDVTVPDRWWPWVTGGFAASVGLGTPLLWLASRAIVYHEAELWGAALAILGFERVVAWWSSRRPGDLVAASAVAALALSTRGSSGMGPALALAGLAVVLAARRSWRLAALALAAAVVPVVLYAAVNTARFDTAFSVPFDRQVLDEFSATRRAALAANDGTLFGVEFAPTTALQYLRPDTVGTRALAPWLGWGARADVVGDVTFDTIDRSGSLPVTAPAFLVAAGIGVVALFRRRPPACWPIAVAAGAVAVVPTLTIAFIAQRYLADFVPSLVVAAALGVPVATAWAARSMRRARGLAGVAVALVAVAVFVNAGLAVLARFVYVLPTADERRGFVAAQYALDDLLGGGGPPPSVVQVDALGPVAADGTVAILGACDGLFRSVGDAWVALELRPGGAQRAVVTGTAPGPVAHGDVWQVLLEGGADGRRVVYDGPTRMEGPVLDGTGPIEIDIAADPTQGVDIAVDGEHYLAAFLQPAGGPVVAAPGWSARQGDEGLCGTLRRRMG